MQRADGWEKRWGWRCARCGVGIGYELEGGGGHGGTEGKEGRVIYILEGGLSGTEEMMGDEVVGGV